MFEIDEVILENYIANKSDISDTDLASLLDEEDIQIDSEENNN